MTYSPNESKTEMYVTRTQLDRSFYKGLYNSTPMAFGQKGKLPYEQIYMTSEELKIPSFDTRRKAMKQAANSKEMKNTIYCDIGRSFAENMLSKKIKSLNNVAREVRENAKMYAESAIKIISSGNQTIRVYMEKLERRLKLF